MKQIKFLLRKRTKDETAKGEKMKYTFSPDNVLFSGEIDIVVKSEGGANFCDVPTETIGDAIFIDFGAKQIQTKIDLGQDKDAEVNVKVVDKERKSKTINPSAKK